LAFYRNFKNIVIMGPSDYEGSIVAHLDKVWGTWTGWAVLRGILDTGKTVTIVPYSPDDEKRLGGRNADARPTDARAASPRGFRPYVGGADDPATKEDERYRRFWYWGNGEGSDSVVHISPEFFKETRCSYRRTPTGPCLYSVYAQNVGPDDTLLHELVHALRYMRGHYTAYPTRIPEYDNEEEYFAILLQNTYGSEKGLTVLRRHHHGFTTMKSSLATSEGFLGKGQRPLSFEQLENRLLVRKFTNECFALCQNINTRVRAAFNPIGEFLRNPFQYPYDPKLAYPLR